MVQGGEHQPVDLHRCLLELEGAHDLKHIWVWHSHNVVQLGIPPFEMVVHSAITQIMDIPEHWGETAGQNQVLEKY